MKKGGLKMTEFNYEKFAETWLALMQTSTESFLEAYCLRWMIALVEADSELACKILKPEFLDYAGKCSKNLFRILYEDSLLNIKDEFERKRVATFLENTLKEIRKYIDPSFSRSKVFFLSFFLSHSEIYLLALNKQKKDLRLRLQEFFNGNHVGSAVFKGVNDGI
jgi:hypothetical protein